MLKFQTNKRRFDVRKLIAALVGFTYWSHWTPKELATRWEMIRTLSPRGTE